MCMGDVQALSGVRYCWWFMCEERGVAKNWTDLIKDGSDLMNVIQIRSFSPIEE